MVFSKVLISMKIVVVQPEKKATADVDVQHLGNQAVIKIVCTRRHGHVLRVLHALEECKVNVLQSNVTTVGENSIHFITVEVNLTYYSLQQALSVIARRREHPLMPS